MDQPKKFRKKPVEIEAWKFTGFAADQTGWDILRWIDPTGRRASGFGQGVDTELHIATLEGVMIARIGDWIIKGVQGEFYPCKPDIFTATYESV